MNISLHISGAGLAIEKKYEQGPEGGFANRAYLCPAGKLTIGYGHVIVSAGDYMRTAEINEDTACTLLANDNLVAENAVKRYVTVALNQYEFDALTALTFNIGEGNFATSTLVKKLNAGDKRGAADEFLVWDKFHDPHTNLLRVAPGLAARRAEERTLFLEEDNA
jgi:lysozyme